MAAWLEWCLLLPCCVASGLFTLTSPLSTIQSLSLSLSLVVVACCGCHFGHQSMVLFFWCVCECGMADGHHGKHQSVLHCGLCVGHLCEWLEPW